jgi:hypothetical protein
VWTFPDEFNAIRISYDENPEAAPTLFYSTTTSEMSFNNVRDGVYYLHLQVRDKGVWSKVSNFKFLIDTERPENFTITELDKGNTAKTQSEFTFDAKDNLSGLDHFEISIDDSAPEIITDISNQYYKTAVLPPGKHIIFIKAYDKAGNFVPSSALFYINPSTALPGTIQKIISDIENYSGALLNSAISAAGNLAGQINKFVNSPLGSIITKAIAAVGLITVILIPLIAFLASTSLADMWLLLAGFLLSAFGLKEKNRSWGIVYDSVTKRPLNAAHVFLIDLETGKISEDAITDSYGRYRFKTSPGRYGIETRKTDYTSPSKKMEGKSFDIRSKDEVIVKNIPMDSLSFNWSRFVKERMDASMFIKAKIMQFILNALFIIGIIFAIIAGVFAPAYYNLVILGIYLLYCVSIFIFKEQRYGALVEEGTNLPLSFAIINIYRQGENNPLVRKVADKYGMYFAQVPGGKYYLTVDKKNNDESYTEVLRTEAMEIKDGVINFNIKL